MRVFTPDDGFRYFFGYYDLPGSAGPPAILR